MLRKNEIHRITVTDLNHLGFGVGRVDGQVVFVSGAVTGDEAEVRIIAVKKNYAVARTERILRPSPYRVDGGCTVRGCGGCVYRAVTYEYERQVKRRVVENAFRRVGLPAQVASVQSVGPCEHYRNKAQYPVAAASDGLRIGFFGAKSHRVVEAADCRLQPPVFAQIVAALRGFFEERRIPAYDEESHTGLLRHIYLRRATVTGELLLTLVLNGSALPDEAGLVSCARAAAPALVGILINENTARTNVICGDKYRVLWGRDYMVDELCGVRLRITPAAFYQVNHDAAEALYRRARELAALTGRETLFDLYCGVGSIGLSMADGAAALYGIEISESAVACAKQNARDNGIENAHFFCADAAGAEHILDRAEASLGRAIVPDVVLLDPPRKGCEESLLDFICERSPARIVYISCNPETLARDAAYLCARGYGMGEVFPYDLFPRTGHVESVVCFKK